MIATNRSNGLFMGIAFFGAAPALILGLLHITTDFLLHPGIASFIFGVGILSSAFLLSWGAEAAERDISGSLALALVAIITVLPEYAVDFTLSWKAGSDPQYVHYAVANMTGANRLLIGLAWPLVVLLTWFRRRIPHVQLHRNQAIDIGFLAVATLWAFKIVLFRHLDLLDAAVLIGLFVAYMWLNSRAEVHEPNLIGPAAMVGRLPKAWRRATVLFLFIFPAAIIFISAEPFAEGLITSGKNFGIDEFLLIQWVAPLASEAPEVIVASIFALRGDSASALGMLISAKVNQWTLLIGSLPVVYSVSTGSPAAMPLDGRQVEEVLLTAAQSGFAMVLLAPLLLSPRGSLILFLLFITQLFLTHPTIRLAYSGVYAGATILLLLFDGKRRGAAFYLPKTILQESYLVGARKHPEPSLAEPEHQHTPSRGP